MRNRWRRRGLGGVWLWIALAVAVSAAALFNHGGEKAWEEGPEEGEASVEESGSAAVEEGDLVGLWVPYFSLSTEEGTQAAFEENYKAIVRRAKEQGVNAMFVHVRPFSDSLYPSALYPWSHVLTGEQGKDPGFDPLAFLVEYTHSQGMEFHAWLNPLRVKTAQTPGALSPESPYEKWKGEHPYYFMEWEGGVYLDPAYPEVRSLIAQGVGEIVENYQVDGVHFDDYFYPSQDPSLDGEAYELYCQQAEEPVDLLTWRQANVNALVSLVYRAVKETREQAVFGISPQGNIENDLAMGADVTAWAAVPGYVDYLCPQLYYSFENPALGYSQALEQWDALPRWEGLRLYAGLALYKAGSQEDQGTWLGEDNILERQALAAWEAGWDGVVLYAADSLTAAETQAELANAAPLLRERGRENTKGVAG